MSDSISRQAAIEAIENTDWYHQNSNKDMVNGASNEHEAWYKAEDIDMAIEALQAEPKTGEWIPCSERLPNEDECGWYLVTVKGHELFVDVAPFNDKLWKGLYSNQEVLAWKPLPMPYRDDFVESEVEE